MALHPSGLHCAVGFVDKLRLYHVLVDDVRLCLEVSEWKNVLPGKLNKIVNLSLQRYLLSVVGTVRIIKNDLDLRQQTQESKLFCVIVAC